MPVVEMTGPEEQQPTYVFEYEKETTTRSGETVVHSIRREYVDVVEPDSPRRQMLLMFTLNGEDYGSRFLADYDLVEVSEDYVEMQAYAVDEGDYIRRYFAFDESRNHWVSKSQLYDALDEQWVSIKDEPSVIEELRVYRDGEVIIDE